MKGKRFKEEQIIKVLHEAERGMTVAEVCRQHNCSEQSFYRWKAKFGGMEVSDVKRLRELQRENSELKKILGLTTQWVHRALYPNHVWSYDFVFDQTGDHRTLKCMTVVDEFTREAFDIHVGRSITSHDVIRILDRLFQQHGRPVCLRSDNGPELIASAVQKWLKKMHVNTHYIEPGSPWQNGYCESFNSIFRITCLDRWWFNSLTEARVVINQWFTGNHKVQNSGYELCT